MLSVVILTYNSGRTIHACLDSLARQSPAPAEIIVVDDDSTDTTLTVVGEFAATVGITVRVLRNGSHNISRGRNIGLAAAQSRLVAFLDSDARAEPGWTAAMADGFAAYPDVAIVGGDVVTAHASRFAEAIALNDSTVRQFVTSGALLVSGCNMAVDVDRIGPERFDERWVHAEDIEFVDRVRHRARWVLAPAARVWHESRIDPRGYFRQMYRYGLWKTCYTLRTGNIRAVDYVPSAVLLTAMVGSVISPWLLLAYPALSVAETLFVAAYRRAPVRLVPLMLAGWLVKNTGWGLGVLVALARQVTGRSAVPPPAVPPQHGAAATPPPGMSAKHTG